MNELTIVAAMSIVCILWAIVTYSVGYKEGKKDGYLRGRATARALNAADNEVNS